MAARRKTIIKIPLFEGEVEVYTNKKEVIKRLLEIGLIKLINEAKNERFLNDVYGCVFYEVKKAFHIVVYLPPTYKDTLVAHELVHVITAIFKYYNLPAPKEGKDEIFARYMDYFFETIKFQVYNIQEETE